MLLHENLSTFRSPVLPEYSILWSTVRLRQDSQMTLDLPRMAQCKTVEHKAGMVAVDYASFSSSLWWHTFTQIFWHVVQENNEIPRGFLYCLPLGLLDLMAKVVPLHFLNACASYQLQSRRQKFAFVCPHLSQTHSDAHHLCSTADVFRTCHRQEMSLSCGISVLEMFSYFVAVFCLLKNV